MPIKIETCPTKNPLVRDGTSQSQRNLASLHPHYARVDDRLLADFLNYAINYSETLQYYDSNNKPQGEWRDFFDRDLASVIASVANKNNQDIKTLYNQLKTFSEETKSPDALRASGLFESAFDLIFQLANEFNQWLLKASNDSELRKHLLRLVSAELSILLSKTVAAYHYALDYVWFDDGSPNIFNWPIDKSALFQLPLSASWFETGESYKNLSDWVEASNKDATVFTFASDSELARLQQASRTILGWLGQFIQAQTQLINDAPRYLFNVVHRTPNHSPHMALYLAFTRLFKYAQLHLNSFTDRHLDHYYRTILGFEPLAATRDRVHLLFELAKQSEQHLLQKGVLFKAGFDQTGNPVTYELVRELVVNRAKIKDAGDVKSIYIDRASNQGLRIYSAPIANSKDGRGAEFEDEEGKWFAFGSSQLVAGQLKPDSQRTADLAQIGFAFASPLLDLREGKRTIEITIDLNTPVAGTLSAAQFQVLFSGEKSWINGNLFELVQSTTELKFNVELDTTEPPVTSFDPVILPERNFNTQYPVMQILLTHDITAHQTFAYESLKNVIFSGFTIKVTVEGLSDLVVQSDLGTLDANKPFQPFGPRPVVGNSFYIGCDEAFRKPVVNMTLEGQWLDVPSSLTSYYRSYFYDTPPVEPSSVKQKAGNGKGSAANSHSRTTTDKTDRAPSSESETVPISENTIIAAVSTLNDDHWDPLVDSRLFLNPSSKFQITFPQSNDSNGVAAVYFTENPAMSPLKSFSQDRQQGFVRLTLAEPNEALGHKLYSKVYATRVVQLINQPESTLLPNEPYTPVLKDLSLTYTAQSHYQLDSNENPASQFYTLYPFGSVPLSDQSASGQALLPEFLTRIENAESENNGELYIGLSDVKPPQMVTLFFKVAEGSADPELNRETIYWSVLKENRWLNLTSKEISYNTTNDFNATGIVSINIPKDVTSENTLLPGGKVWLRASILKNTNAACQLVQISTQVGEASFINQNNDQQYLSLPLSADSIGKLLIKQSQIKKIQQPYPSQGGKANETSQQLRVRVSERLRHKDRALTIWDYEKLVLQAFDFIYKAKCINHSTFLYERAPENLLTAEFAPGYVTLIVIPDISNQNAINPLEPKTSLDNLDRIKRFLQQRMTPFAAKKLRVMNPLYESIQLEFNVSFYPEYDPALYLETLNRDIIQFLSPWAFFDSRHKEIHFGGKVHRSSLVNFVEERSYVDYVTDFKMHHLTKTTLADGSTNVNGLFNIEQASPTSARSIFVSHPQHVIIAGDFC